RISIDTVWNVCYTTRYGIDHCAYHDQSSALESLIGEKSDEIDAGLTAEHEGESRIAAPRGWV
ncbi:MAG: hypothetical protein QOG17_2208, partial [Gammaproteobacteria bacterium]|nr:hypothetical protein [Gammaproteobacteria bacterium]